MSDPFLNSNLYVACTVYTLLFVRKAWSECVSGTYTTLTIFDGLIWGSSQFLKLLQRETRINWVFQFAPEKLGHFEKLGKNLSVFLKRAIFFQFSPEAKFVRSRGLWLQPPQKNTVHLKSGQKWFKNNHLASFTKVIKV